MNVGARTRLVIEMSDEIAELTRQAREASLEGKDLSPEKKERLAELTEAIRHAPPRSPAEN